MQDLRFAPAGEVLLLLILLRQTQVDEEQRKGYSFSSHNLQGQVVNYSM